MTTQTEIQLPETFEAEGQPHAAYYGWHNFLRTHTELRDQHDGVLYFGATNCNYIVFPSGLLFENFGYRGKGLMADIRDRGVATVEAELRENRKQWREAIDNLFARERKAANDLCDWLLTCPHIESAVPVEVSFGPKDRRHKVQESWFGALYCEKRECAPKETAVEAGPMAVGEITRSYRFYLLGRMFEDSQRGGNWVTVYDLPADRRQPLERCYSPSDEWYVACYRQDTYDTTPQQRLYSPFGPMFMLLLHQQMNFGYYKDWKIDTGERKPYARHQMTVEYLPCRSD